MATDLKCATLTGSGILLDVASSVTIGECRIRNISTAVSGKGSWVIQSTNAMGVTSRIKFWTEGGDREIQLPDAGVRMYGTVISVVAPVSDAHIAVWYG